jgi:hypothetical protein
MEIVLRLVVVVVAVAAYWVIALVAFWLIGNCEIPYPEQCEARSNTGVLFLIAAFVVFAALAGVVGAKVFKKRKT